jgi:uncharacterized protein YqjF (DUF2071 family)
MAELVTPEAPILPWPRVLRQSWLNLSFLHWAVEPASIVPPVSTGTEPDTFEGRSYVGVVPFQMSLFGTFLETNVRLYSVDRTGRRGVVLPQPRHQPAGHGRRGRWIFGVPYRWARMSYREKGDRRALHLDAALAGSERVEFVEVGG